jgi:hypothetical protein
VLTVALAALALVAASDATHPRSNKPFLALLAAQRFYDDWTSGNRSEALRAGSAAAVSHLFDESLASHSSPRPTGCHPTRSAVFEERIGCFAGRTPDGLLFLMAKDGGRGYKVFDVEVMSCTGGLSGTCYFLREG